MSQVALWNPAGWVHLLGAHIRCWLHAGLYRGTNCNKRTPYPFVTNVQKDTVLLTQLWKQRRHTAQWFKPWSLEGYLAHFSNSALLGSYSGTMPMA